MKAQVCPWLLDFDLCFSPSKKQSWEQWPIQVTNFFPKRQVLEDWGEGGALLLYGGPFLPPHGTCSGPRATKLLPKPFL